MGKGDGEMETWREDRAREWGLEQEEWMEAARYMDLQTGAACMNSAAARSHEVALVITPRPHFFIICHR